MTEKLPMGNFKWVKSVSKINEEFMKNYDKIDDTGYYLKVDIEYQKELHDLHIDLPFLPEKIEINEHSKPVCTFYQESWLKPYIEMNTELRKKCKKRY